MPRLYLALASASLALVAVTSSNLSSQSYPGVLREGMRVSFRLPPAAFSSVLEKRQTSSSGEHGPVRAVVSGVRFEATITRAGTSLAVNGDTNWAAAGFAPSSPARIADIDRDSKQRLLRIRLDRRDAADVTVTVPFDDTTYILGRIFAPASDSTMVRHQADSLLAARLFVGALNSLSAVARMHILSVADSLIGDDSLHVVSFQNRPYLRMRAPPSAFIYNVNQTSEPQRQSGVLNEVAFPILRSLASTDSSLSSAFGFAILVTARTKAFAEKYAWLTSPSREEIAIYAPADVARQLANAEITTQDLIDRSAVIVRGNRIKVDLTK